MDVVKKYHPTETSLPSIAATRRQNVCRAAIAEQGGTIVEETNPGLEDIFIAHAGAPVHLGGE